MSPMFETPLGTRSLAVSNKTANEEWGGRYTVQGRYHRVGFRFAICQSRFDRYVRP
jgi:hypothetical protein